MTHPPARSEAHSRENCHFYPACYIAGDCNLDDWKTRDCGLSAEIKAEKHAAWQRQAIIRSERRKLGEELAAEARRGVHDGRLPAAVRTLLQETK